MYLIGITNENETSNKNYILNNNKYVNIFIVIKKSYSSITDYNKILKFFYILNLLIF